MRFKNLIKALRDGELEEVYYEGYVIRIKFEDDNEPFALDWDDLYIFLREVSKILRDPKLLWEVNDESDN